jgi:4-hydroxybenzoate polyprenyltransferase
MGQPNNVRGFKAVKVFLEMIKFEHSIFALPFALIGLMWGSYFEQGIAWPGWRIFGLVIVAMVSCRSAAMAYNRIADRDIDALNERTKNRAIPAGLLSLGQASLFFWISIIVFFAASALLNQLTLILSPVALGVTLFYSRTKRFTALCHFVLGLSLGIAPAASWIAATGRLDPQILPLVTAVMLWTAGFDIIYALQDDTFDREHGLHSIPKKFGRKTALAISRFCHLGAICYLVLSGLVNGAGLWYFIGVLYATVLVIYEQSLVKPNDLSRVNLAFFTLNGFISLGLFVFTLIDKLFFVAVRV